MIEKRAEKMLNENICSRDTNGGFIREAYLWTCPDIDRLPRRQNFRWHFWHQLKVISKQAIEYVIGATTKNIPLHPRMSFRTSAVKRKLVGGWLKFYDLIRSK